MDSLWPVEVTVKVQAKNRDEARALVNAQLWGNPRIESYDFKLKKDDAPAPSPWRPIETAPKDGERFNGIDKAVGDAHTASWHAEQKKWVDYIGKEVVLTHWFPQPAL